MKRGRGYVFSREINGSHIPQRVQNLVIRNYCEKNDLIYLLSGTEYKMHESFMVLKSLVRDSKSYDSLVFYSVHMLPQSDSIRKHFLQTLLDNGKSARFAIEEIRVKSKEDLKVIDDIYLTKKLSSYIPQNSNLKSIFENQ